MTKISEQAFDDGALFDELASAPATPAAGTWRIYPKSDGLYIVDDAGTETGPLGTSGDSGISSGTSFPGTPSDGDLFYRSDLDLLCRYRSTGTRWVSEQVFRIPLVREDSGITWPLTGTTTVVDRGIVPYGGTYDLWLEAWEALSMVLTTNDGTKYWTGSVSKFDAAGSGDTSIASFNTSADSAGAAVIKSVSIGAALGSYVGFYVGAVKTSTPGNWRLVGGALRYRLILT